MCAKVVVGLSHANEIDGRKMRVKWDVRFITNLWAGWSVACATTAQAAVFGNKKPPAGTGEGLCTDAFTPDYGGFGLLTHD